MNLVKAANKQLGYWNGKIFSSFETPGYSYAACIFNYSGGQTEGYQLVHAQLTEHEKCYNCCHFNIYWHDTYNILEFESKRSYFSAF